MDESSPVSDSIMIIIISSISRRGTFSVFNITAHGYILIYIQNQMYFVQNAFICIIQAGYFL